MTSETRSSLAFMSSETRAPVPLLYRRRSTDDINNLATVSSSLLPAFGTVVGEGSLHLRKYVIAPYDRRYRWWLTFLVVLVVYSAWSSPFELAFKKMATGSLLPIDLAVAAFFAVDIVLTFFVAYLDKSTYLLVDNHKNIALRNKQMASSSTNNTNFTFKPRFCNCGRIAVLRIVQTNANGNKGRAYFVCPRKYFTNNHYNYFRWFADDDDDDDITASTSTNAGPRTDSTTEEINDLRTRVGEHDRRLQRMEKMFKAMTYVIVF
ncbi:unnamed protein product [Camellia sinensis]